MKKLLFTFSALLLSVTSYAQSAGPTDAQSFTIKVDQHALLAIDSKTHNFGIQTPTTAGAPITIASKDFSSRIKTSLMVGSSGNNGNGNGNATGSISVLMTGLNEGFALNLTLAPASTAVGDAGGIVNAYSVSEYGHQLPSNTSETVVDGMSTHYTGTGTNDGFLASYELSVVAANYASIKENLSTPVLVTYTIAN